MSKKILIVFIFLNLITPSILATQIFENDSLTKVISDLENYYKKEIVFKDIVPDDYSLNVSFVNLSLEEVMNIITGTFDFNFIIKNDKVYLYTNNKSD